MTCWLNEYNNNQLLRMQCSDYNNNQLLRMRCMIDGVMFSLHPEENDDIIMSFKLDIIKGMFMKGLLQEFLGK